MSILFTLEVYTIFFTFPYFELFSVIIFSIEYLLRIWSCTINDEYGNNFLRRIKFVVNPLSLVDLVAILPFYLPMFIRVDLRMLRILRLFRMMRLVKMGRYMDSLKIIGVVVNRKKEQLLMAAMAMFMLLLFSATLLYVVENKAQPEAFGSIPAAMWWGVAALTSVGYGDVYPITVIGRIFGAIIATLGIGMFALPAGILASGFSEALEEKITLNKEKIIEKAKILGLDMNKNSKIDSDLKKEIIELIQLSITVDGYIAKEEIEFINLIKKSFEEKK
ncbi:MAG: ion transporter [Candidatus Cloacimonetes bacterium]|nr:ion transporter [Candidatus Cloacimonadota bacterium]